MTRTSLIAQIFSKQTYLCVGLDTDPAKIPLHLQSRPDAVFEFNKAIVDATKDHCVAYKINTAFYEAAGAKGWEAMHRTADYIPSTHMKIADAKRGDIGNTSAQYAKAFFETMAFDAITVAPYMGADSVKPFLEFSDKWTIVLGLTSNAGAADFELQRLQNNNRVFEAVMRTVAGWGTPENLMFVVGATNGDEFTNVRRITPNHFYLVPGVGVQGGSLSAISDEALISDCGLLVNASRAIIYASEGEDFAEAAELHAKEYATEMAMHLKALRRS